MIKYVQPKIEISYFEKNIIATDTTASAVDPNYIYAAENINTTLLNGYGSNRATTMKIQDVMSFQ